MLLAKIGKKSITFSELRKENFLVISTSRLDDKVDLFGFRRTSSKFSFGVESILNFFVPIVVFNSVQSLRPHTKSK
jgi:hypothetical protein